MNTYHHNIYKNNYNYYELAIQKWCHDEYQIHGLWPQINQNEYPTYCIDVNYSIIEDEFKIEMNKYWNNHCNVDNQEFWEHEWKKHGSCVREQLNYNQNDYFNKTIELFKQLLGEYEKCNGSENCILGCFDLEFKKIECK